MSASHILTLIPFQNRFYHRIKCIFHNQISSHHLPAVISIPPISATVTYKIFLWRNKPLYIYILFKILSLGIKD